MGMTLVETGIVLNGTARAAAQAKPMRALDRAKAFGKPITIPEFGARLCATAVPATPAAPSAPQRRRLWASVRAAGTTPCYYGECERDACRINSTGLGAKVDWVRSRHRNNGHG